MTEPVSRLNAALDGRYRIEREIGEGGMANVYVAEDLKHQRRVALKVLKESLAAVVGADRFLAEIRTTAKLQHPNILPLFDSGEADGHLFYVMPFIEGETLRERLRHAKQLPVDEAVRIASEVAEALDYAHHHGVIHRDIKPANVLLSNGRPLVADFGIALAVSAVSEPRLTETGLSLGTPHYMSPEQATGDWEVDARTDIYSLGAVLYEMLTGDPPYGGPSIRSIVAKILTAEPEPVAAQRGTVPLNVSAAVHKALSKLPADRFANAAEFARALANPAFTFSTTATRIGTAFVDARWKRRAVAAMGLASALGLVAAWGWLRPDPPGSVSYQRIALWAEQPTARGVGQELVLAPDGSAIVFVDTLEGQRRLMVKERGRLAATAVSDAVDPGGPFFSPDGAWIGFWADGALKTVPRSGGANVTVVDSVQRTEPAGAWLADGSIVFVRDDRLWRVDTEGSSASPASEAAIPGLWFLAPLPGSRGVVFSSCQGSCHRPNVQVLDLATGEVTLLFEDAILAFHVETGHLVYVGSDGGVFAAPFDLGSLAVEGPSLRVLEGVATTGPSAALAVTPGGTLLYMAGPQIAPTGLAEAVWIDRDGRVTLVDPSWTFRPAQESGLALSPDGSYLAVSVEEDLRVDVWIKQLPGGPFSRLTFADSSDYRPRWKADGRTVLYVSNGADGCDLMARRADGSSPPDTELSGRNACLGQVSSDGAWLVYRTDRPDGRGDIMAVATDGSGEPRELISTRFHETSPELSPDGAWLAYASDESGRSEVYLQPFPDVAQGRWTVSTAGGSMPLWSRSGDELLYINGAGELVSATFSPGPPPTTTSRTLFSMAIEFSGISNDRAGVRMFDVAPDGRIVALRGAGAARINDPVDIVLAENWLEEIDGRLRD